MIRRSRIPLLFSCVLAATVGPAMAMVGHQTKASESPSHLLVTFKSSMADVVEQGIAMDSLPMTHPRAEATVKSFMASHRIKRLEPLHKDMVLRKRTTGKTGRQLADEVRDQFRERARRFRGFYNPPDLTRTYVVTPSVASQAELDRLTSELKRDPGVEAVSQEQIYNVQFTPNDPYYTSTGSWGQTYPDLYGLQKISTSGAWDLAEGSGVVVAVVDTGIDYTHPDLAANVWTNPSDGTHGYNFVANTTDPKDDHGHGTHVAGTIAAVGNNNLGVIGVAWNAKIMGVKGLDASGSGTNTALAQAITWATNHGAQVINMSWGYQGPADPTLDSALAYAHNLGVILVAAAGNSAIDASLFYPASSPYVITVSAFDWNDQIAYFSDYGYKIDVAAPGVNILSLQAAGTALGPVVSPGYIYLSGTSMATPHVVGLAALILSQHPTYTNEQVRQVIRASADDVGAPGFDIQSGYGRINAFHALQLPAPPPPDTTPPMVSIVSPTIGATLSGTVAVSGTASDNVGVAQVVIAVDNVTSGVATGTGTWTYSLDTTALGNGVHTLSATAYDFSGNPSTATVSVSVSNAAPSGQALYNSVYLAPICASVGSACDSGTLLNGRAAISGGPELHNPNTIGNSCGDGTAGIYHSDESNDRIRIFTVDGSSFAAGKTVQIQATVWAYVGYLSDALDLYYASSVSSSSLPTWTYLKTIVPASAGQNVLSSTFTLQNGNLQAVRAVFRYSGSAAPCTAGLFDDHDDLIFAVANSTDTTPPSIPTGLTISSATDTSLRLTWTASTDNIGVQGYRLDVSTAASFSSMIPGFANNDVGNATQALIFGLSPNSTYYMRLRAYDAAMNVSSNSAVLSAATLPDTNPPSAPTNLYMYSQSTQTLFLSCTASKDDVGVAGYRVDLSTDPAFGSFSNGYANQDLGNQTNFLLSGLSPGTTYFARLRAYDISGNVSANSAVSTGTTLSPSTSDLFINQFYVSPSSVAPGGTFQLVATIVNQGMGTDPAPTLEFFLDLSTAPYFSVVGPALAPGQFWTSNVPMLAPAAPRLHAWHAFVIAASSDSNPTNNDAWTYLTVATGTATDTYLSDLPWISVSTGVPPVERDLTVAGNPMVLNGVSYAKGLGSSSNTDIVYLGPLGQQCAIISTMGVDDEAGPNNGSVQFSVYGNSTGLIGTGTMAGGQASQTIMADVSNYGKLTLRTVSQGGSTVNDHADWAGARLHCNLVPDKTPPVMSNPSAVNITTNSVTFTWQTDELANSRADVGPTTSYGYLALDYQARTSHSLQMNGLQPGTIYHYRLSSQDAFNNTGTTGDLTFTTMALDTIPPTISITTPTFGATVSGDATIAATATDNVGVTAVYFYIDGVLVSSMTSAPYTFTWNTLSAMNETHTILAQAVDAAGNVGSNAIVVLVSNHVLTTLTVNPANAALSAGATLQFSVSGTDQLGMPMPVSSATWSASVGSITADGLYTAAYSTAPVIVTVAAEALTSTATITIINLPPTVWVPASATPNPVYGSSTTASVLGSDDGGEPALTYTWTSTGPASAALSDNGDNTAKTTVVTFSQAGTYNLDATIQDQAGQTVDSSTTVVVYQTLTALSVNPNLIALIAGATQQFAVTGTDQFGQPMTVSSITWSASAGVIDGSGLFTAVYSTNPITITATAGGLITLSTVTLINLPPTIAASANAAPNPVTGSSTTLSVLGADDGGEPSLTYLWTSTGPAAVTFSDNGTNTAKNAVAAFSQAGTYTMAVTIQDQPGLTTTSSTMVVVNQTVTTVSIVPPSATLLAGATLQFAASAADQFGNAVTSPAVIWTASIGTITASGLYTAAYSTQPVQITASIGGINTTAPLTVFDIPPIITQPITPAMNPVLGSSVAVSVSAIDVEGANSLTYTWSATGGPVTFYPNGTAAAQNTMAVFSQAGTYNFQVAIQNLVGNVTVSTAAVLVSQTVSSLTVSPSSASLITGATIQFAASITDQFGNAMAAPVTWSASNGAIASSGLYTAVYSTSPIVILAQAGSQTAAASLTIINQPPTIAIPAAASPNPVTATNTTLSVLGADDGGESNLTYAWSASGPSDVTFSLNGTNAAKATLAGFTVPGTYTFQVTVKDAQGLTITSSTSAAVIVVPAATFLNTDTTTRGNWKGVYGSEGFDINSAGQSFPAYEQAAISGALSILWSNNTTSLRALEKPYTSGRIASAWYSTTRFSMNLNSTDLNTHEVAIYVEDWNTNNLRRETIELRDAGTNALLDSRSATSFRPGVYFRWNVKGNVLVNVINNNATTNAVVNGFFFGATSLAPAAPATSGGLAADDNLDQTDFGTETPAISGRVRPNPWRSDRDAGTSIVIDQIPAGSTVKIFDLAGYWVTTLDGSTGQASWDRTNNAGQPVASGLYLYLVTDPQGNTAHGKLAIIK